MLLWKWKETKWFCFFDQRKGKFLFDIPIFIHNFVGVNKYKIIYFYKHECVGDFVTKYQTIMFDTSPVEVIKKFEAKYPHASISAIHVETEECGVFESIRKRRNQN